MTTEKKQKMPELRGIWALERSGLGVLAAIVLVMKHGMAAWFMKHFEGVTFFEEKDARKPGRQDIIAIGPNGTIVAENGRTYADAVARLMGIHKSSGLFSVLKAIRRSVNATRAETFPTEPVPAIEAVPQAEELRELKVIITHKFAHLDELVAIALLLIYGNGRLFRWTELPQIIFSENEEADLKTYSRRPDAYFVGIGSTGRGRKALVSDEHRKSGRLPDTCATDLVAERLGIENEPSLQWLFNEVRKSDTKAEQERLGLGHLLKVVQNYGDYTEEALMFWIGFIQDVVLAFQQAGTAFKGQLDLGLAIEVINRYGSRTDTSNLEVVERSVMALSNWAKEFNVHCPKEFVANKGQLIELPNGIRIAVIRSDRYAMGSWARSAKGAHIVVQGYSTGHMRFYGVNNAKHPHLKDLMTRTAGVLMVQEMRTSGKTEEEVSTAWEEFQEFNASNDLPGNVPIYLQIADNCSILNGSRSHEREAIKLSLEDAADTIRQAFEALMEEGTLVEIPVEAVSAPTESVEEPEEQHEEVSAA